MHKAPSTHAPRPRRRETALPPRLTADSEPARGFQTREEWESTSGRGRRQRPRGAGSGHGSARTEARGTRFAARPRTAAGRRRARPAGRGAPDSVARRRPACPVRRRPDTHQRGPIRASEKTSTCKQTAESGLSSDLSASKPETRAEASGTNFIRPREPLDFLFTSPGLKRTSTLTLQRAGGNSVNMAPRPSRPRHVCGNAGEQRATAQDLLNRARQGTDQARDRQEGVKIEAEINTLKNARRAQLGKQLTTFESRD